MDKLIPISILAAIIVIGFFSKVKALSTIDDRIEFTSDYQKKFAEYINKILSNRTFDRDLYYELTYSANAMQYELGEDGVLAAMKDPQAGLMYKNYQLLINCLPETKRINSSPAPEYYNTSICACEACEDAFIRHLGALDRQKENIRKGLFNPLSLFAVGTKVIIIFILLSWFGFVPIEKIDRAKNNMLVKLLNAILSLLGLAGTIISIVVGWNDFWNMVFKFFK